MEHLIQQIHNVIAPYTEQHVNSDSHLFLDLEIDTMNAVRIAGDLENEFDIEISGLDVAHWVHVHDIVNYVLPKIKD